MQAYAASNPLAHLPSKNVLFLAFPPTPPLSAPALASSLAGNTQQTAYLLFHCKAHAPFLISKRILLQCLR